MRSFRSYAEEKTFDFTDRTLIGVVGPIGSGKSTILDAIAFALYGQTPTEKSATRSLIHQRHDSSHVELWFGVGSDTWKAVRALRRKGQSGHALSRHDGIDGERLELIEGEKAVNAKVTELLGLDFHAFGRSVLLAQNQFDSFLRTSDGERDKVLKGVFGLDRLEAVRDLAKQRRDEAGRDLEELQRRRHEIEADRVALEAARTELEPLRSAAQAFTAAVPVAESLEAAIAQAAHEQKAAQKVAASLQETASRLPSRTETAALLAASEADAAAVAAAEEDVLAATAELADARKDHDSVISELGDREALARAESLVSKAAELEKAVSEQTEVVAKAGDAAAAANEAVAAAEAEHHAAGSAVAEAVGHRDEARTSLTEAESGLHQAQHAEMAATLRSELHEGDSCPVCGQEVGELVVGASADLTAAEKAVKAAKAAMTKADSAVSDANHRLSTAAAALAAATARRDETIGTAEARRRDLTAEAERLSAARSEVTTALGDGDPVAALADRRRLIEETETALAAATSLLASAEKLKGDAVRSADERRRAMQRLANEVAALSGTLGSELSVEPSRESLGDALDRLRGLWETRSAEAEDGIKEAAKKVESAIADRIELHAQLGIERDADFAGAHASAVAAAAAATEKVSLLTERVTRVEALEKENSATVKRHEVFTRIAEDLAPSKLLAYLLDEERIALSELAADRFEMLSGGRYRFSEDGSFDVLDLTAAEAVRKPRSLSGGETFLASLALALALAEMVSRSGGRLEAFFLDEGFGSLDTEHLDLAMEGIERIVADDPDRLILVVSHVGELRQRLEDVIELGKDQVTGDTVVVRA